MPDILRKYGLDPSLAVTEEELERARHTNPYELSSFDRGVLRAMQSTSFGFYRPHLPEAHTTGEKAADIIGSIAGYIPAVAISSLTAGAPAAAAAGRVGLGALGQAVARELGTGLAFEAMQLPGRIYHGDSTQQIATDALMGVGTGVGLSLAGRGLSEGYKALRGLGRGSDVIGGQVLGLPSSEPASRLPLPPKQLAEWTIHRLPKPLKGLPGIAEVADQRWNAAVDNYLGDIRRFYEANPQMAYESWENYATQMSKDFSNTLKELSPEIERRIKRNTIAPLKRSNQRLWVYRHLGGEVPLEEIEKLGSKELQSIVKDIESGLGGPSREGAIRETLIDSGVDVDWIDSFRTPGTPEELVDNLISMERDALFTGRQGVPHHYIDQVNPQPNALMNALSGNSKEALEQVSIESGLQNRDPMIRRVSQGILDVEESANRVIGGGTVPPGRAIVPVDGSPVPPRSAIKSSRTTNHLGHMDDRQVVERILGEDSPLNPANEANWGNASYGAIERNVRLPEHVFRRMGKEGQRVVGAERARLINRDRISHTLTTQTVRPMTRLSPKEQWAVRHAIEGKTPGIPLTERMHKVMQQIQDGFTDVSDGLRAKGALMEVWDETAGEMVKVPFDPTQNYFPRLFDWKKIADPKSTYGFDEELLDHLVKAGVARDLSGAANFLTSARTEHFKGTPLAFFQRARTLPDVPDKFLLAPDVTLELWARKAADQLSLIEAYGPDGRRLADMLGEIQAKYPQKGVHQFLKTAREEMLGIRDHGEMSKFVSELMGANIIKHLGFSQILNTTQALVGGSTRYGLLPTLRGFMEYAFASPENKRLFIDQAMQAGAMLDPDRIVQLVTDATQEGFFSRAAAKFLKVTGFTFTERLNQTVAPLIARREAPKMLQAVREAMEKGSHRVGKYGTVQRVRRIFNQAGVDLDGIVKSGRELTENELVQLSKEANRAINFAPDALDRRFWTNTPMGRMWFQYKYFMDRMAGMMRQEIMRDATRWARTQGREGSIRPLINFMVVGSGAGWTVGEIRRALAGRDKDLDRTFIENAIDGLAWVGGMSLAQELATLVTGSGWDQLAFMTGPSGSTIRELLEVGRLGVGVYHSVFDPAQAEEDYAAGKRALVRAVTPSQIGRPLARGEVPIVHSALSPESQDRALMKINQFLRPAEASAEAVARKRYNEAEEDITRGYVIAVRNDLVGKPNTRALEQAIQKAARRGIYIPPNRIEERINSPSQAIKWLRFIRRDVKEPGMRAIIDAMIAEHQTRLDEQRTESLPETVQPMRHRLLGR